MPPLTARVGGADVPQLRGLHAVSDWMLAHPPRLAALLQRRVIQVAVIGEQPRRPPFLRARQVGAELERTPHRAPTFRHGRSFCVSMYRHTVSADTASALAPKYDRDHEAGNRDRRYGDPARSREVNLLTWLAIREAELHG
jgi:hypothetical protein